MTLARRLPTTRWSLVVRSAGDVAADPVVRQSLEELCQMYWPALYGYLRHRGKSRHDSEDLIQGFFEDLLQRGAIAKADASRGRFRAFLYSSLDHYVANQHRHQQAAKRGGGAATFSMQHPSFDWDRPWEASRTGRSADPAAVFDRHWALWLIRSTLTELEAEYAEANRSRWFTVLRPTIEGEDLSAEQRRAMAEELGISATALKVGIHRLRARYREKLLDAIAQTVEDPAESNAERQWLFEVLGEQ